jgi:hypothetical protein
MTVSSQTRDQVASVLADLVVAARSGDASALAGCAGPDITGFWFGRAVHGPEELGAVVAEPFTLADPEIACEGTIAWVTAHLVRAGPPVVEGGFTAVLRGTGHAWLLAQVHASLPA